MRIEMSGELAFEEVRKFVELGPRDSGTAGAERAAHYLADRLRGLGIEAEIQAYVDPTPRGDMLFRNVIGRMPGKAEKIVLLASHYDTKAGIEDFAGANDSGSSTGLLLELARVLSQGRPHPMEIMFAFFDGEECQVEYGPNDGLHGSRHLAQAMEEDGHIKQVAAMILLDMVGDRNLTVTIPRNGDPELISMAFDMAREEGVRHLFQLYPYPMLDDHAPFVERGVPAIDLIDFQYGTAQGMNDQWHTAEDTLDKLSADSLEIVGRVALRMVDQIMLRGGVAGK